MSNETVTPSVASLSITTSDAEFINSGDMRLIITGAAPGLFIQPTAAVVGSLSLTGQQAFRGFGLQLTGQSVSLNTTITVSAVSFSLVGRVPQILDEPPDKVAPDTVDLSLSSDRPGVSVKLNAFVGALSFSSSAPVADVATPFFAARARMTVSGVAPTTSIDYVGGSIKDGTLVENTNATTDSENRYNICERTGFKVKPGELVKDGYGSFVRPESWEPRHQQERVKTVAEEQFGAMRPEPVGDERFIDEEYPDGVDSDTDLDP